MGASKDYRNANEALDERIQGMQESNLLPRLPGYNSIRESDDFTSTLIAEMAIEQEDENILYASGDKKLIEIYELCKFLRPLSEAEGAIRAGEYIEEISRKERAVPEDRIRY